MAYAVLGTAGREDCTQRPGQLALHRRPRVVFWCAVAIASALGVFVLPFGFPRAVPTFSNSYAYGFNNSIAQLFAVCASAVVLVALWMRRDGRRPPEGQTGGKMPLAWLCCASLAAVAFTAVLGVRVVQANIFYSDASHIMTQLGRVMRDHAVLYRDVEYPYGPILFYWPAGMQLAFTRIGLSSGAAYMTTLASMQVLGLCMAFSILQWLPLTRRLRGLALFLFTFATLTPLLGLNYTLLRFLLPHALFLAILRCQSLPAQAGLFLAGEVVALGFSPEIGVAFLGGAVCYAVYRAFISGPSWVIAALSPFAGSALFAAIMGREYFSVMGRFAIGAFNLIVAPDFHILVLLTAAIALSPIAVAGYLQTRHPRAAAMVGFYIISLGMFAPALGRCDSLHTFFGGLGVYLLSLAAVSGVGSRPARMWVVALSLAIVCSQVEDFVHYRDILHDIFFGRTDEEVLDVSLLEPLTHGQRIAAPVMIPQRASQELIRLGQLQPSYFVYLGGVWDDAAERRKIDDMRHAPFALIPDWDYRTTHDEIDKSRQMPLLHVPIRYRMRFKPWVQGSTLAREIRDHWTWQGSVGDYSVYRQNGR